MSPKIIKNPAYNTSTFKFKDFTELDESELHFSTPVSHEPFEQDSSLDFEQSISSEVDIQKIVQKAKQDADLILRKAREEAAQIEKTAYERGLKEGQKSGELIAQQQMQPVLARYQSAVQSLLTVRNQIENEAQIDLAEVVLECAEKVIKSQLELHPGTLLAIIRDGMIQLKNKEGLILFVSSADYAYLRQAQIEPGELGLDGQHRLEEDSKLSRGSIRIQTSAGELDARIETKLNHIRQAMAQTLSQKEG